MLNLSPIDTAQTIGFFEDHKHNEKDLLREKIFEYILSILRKVVLYSVQGPSDG